jgi:hypothetical protein
MVAQASQCSPISYISWREQREVDLATTAPDIASLALYDYYPHPEVIRPSPCAMYSIPPSFCQF